MAIESRLRVSVIEGTESGDCLERQFTCLLAAKKRVEIVTQVTVTHGSVT